MTWKFISYHPPICLLIEDKYIIHPTYTWILTCIRNTRFLEKFKVWEIVSNGVEKRGMFVNEWEMFAEERELEGRESMNRKGMNLQSN